MRHTHRVLCCCCVDDGIVIFLLAKLRKNVARCERVRIVVVVVVVRFVGKEKRGKVFDALKVEFDCSLFFSSLFLLL